MKVRIKKLPTIADKTPPRRDIKAIEKTFVASIPNNPNKLIRVASLVPSPLTVIGICPTSVEIGSIAKK